MAVVKRSKKKQEDGKAKTAQQFVSDAAYREEPAVNPAKMVRPKLYVEQRILDLVNQARVPPSRTIKVSQNQWIVEAIVEKLGREGLSL